MHKRRNLLLKSKIDTFILGLSWKYKSKWDVRTLKSQLNIDDKQIAYIVENIKSNREIIEFRQDDIKIKKSMQELAAKAGAVGVPRQSIYQAQWSESVQQG